MDCGPTCLCMVAKHYGKTYSLPYLRERSYIDRAGVSLKGVSEAAEHIGLRSLAVKIPYNNKKNEPSLLEAPLPAILHWNQNHFVVAYKANKKHVWIADPADGKHKLNRSEFEKSWLSDGEQGIALLVEPSNSFYDTEHDQDSKTGFGFMFQYLKPHRKMMIQLLLGLLLGTVFQLIFPFLTQSLVDIGIDTKNLNFINIILAGQLMLFFSSTVVRFIQNWMLLHISVRLNVNLISDFPFGVG